MSRFELSPRLAANTIEVGDLKLCRVLLMNDARYPWLILVPRRFGLREIYELEPKDRAQVLDESCRVSAWMQQSFAPDKINIGALGNLVPQLHIHHVARFRDDPAWPGPVWGHSAADPYEAQASHARLKICREGLEID